MENGNALQPVDRHPDDSLEVQIESKRKREDVEGNLCVQPDIPSPRPDCEEKQSEEGGETDRPAKRPREADLEHCAQADISIPEKALEDDDQTPRQRVLDLPGTSSAQGRPAPSGLNRTVPPKTQEGACHESKGDLHRESREVREPTVGARLAADFQTYPSEAVGMGRLISASGTSPMPSMLNRREGYHDKFFKELQQGVRMTTSLCDLLRDFRPEATGTPASVPTGYPTLDTLAREQAMFEEQVRESTEAFAKLERELTQNGLISLSELERSVFDEAEGFMSTFGVGGETNDPLAGLPSDYWKGVAGPSTMPMPPPFDQALLAGLGLDGGLAGPSSPMSLGSDLPFDSYMNSLLGSFRPGQGVAGPSSATPPALGNPPAALQHGQGAAGQSSSSLSAMPLLGELADITRSSKAFLADLDHKYKFSSISTPAGSTTVRPTSSSEGPATYVGKGKGRAF